MGAPETEFVMVYGQEIAPDPERFPPVAARLSLAATVPAVALTLTAVVSRV